MALAIAPDPDLLILDDPTLGLDTVARHDFLLSMIHLVQRRGRTILFSSHILADVERVADRVGILVDGVLRVDCPTDRFKEGVGKIVLEFDGRPPAFPGCPGLVQAWEVGHRLELIVVDFGAEQQRVVESLGPIAWDVVGLNLEDAFVAYTRGPRRSLPVFGDLTTEDPEVGRRSRSRIIMNMHKASIGRRLLAASVLAVGFGTLWSMLAIWIGTFGPRFAGVGKATLRQETLVVAADGTPLIQSIPLDNLSTLTYRDLDGRARDDVDPRRTWA